MQTIISIAELREQLKYIRHTGKKIILVPTMGNLHEGHLSLVRQAQTLADYVVVSIFVNPTQFVVGEDFDAYPRTLDDDLHLLDQLNVNLVFTPNTSEIYPHADSITTEVTVPELDSIYCGEFRPGHFKGVATIVTKLFNIVQPDMAIFGEKDYQQLLVIRSLVKNLDIPIEIIGSPTVREEDGLAMSSRNRYLNKTERKKAPVLYAAISKVAEAIEKGEQDLEKLEKQAVSDLEQAGFKPEYVQICDTETLKKPINQGFIVICAAWLGNARLIDNVAVQYYD